MLARRGMSSGMGAAIYFLGVVRESEEGAKLSAIDYEAFPKMVEHQFELIFEQIEKRDCSPLVRFLEPLYPEQELANWAKEKFAVIVDRKSTRLNSSH